jgi:hypothetical protein
LASTSDTSFKPLKPTARVIPEFPISEEADLANPELLDIGIYIPKGPVQDRLVVNEDEILSPITTQLESRRFSVVDPVSHVGPDGVVEVLESGKFEEGRY